MTHMSLTQPITMEQFSPVLLKATIFNNNCLLPKTYKLNERYVYDYELEYILYSEGAMRLDGVTHPLHRGDLVFRRPGQLNQGIMPYSCYLICFDLSGTSGKRIETYNFNNETQFQVNYRCNFLDTIPLIFQPQSPDIYETLFDKIFTERINYSETSPVIIKSQILRLLYEIYSNVTHLRVNTPLSPHYARLKRSLDFIHNQYSFRISLKDIAEVAELSPTYFHKIFTETIGMTPNEYLNKIRLDHAKQLLVRTAENISQIAADCGFENTAYFSYLFKKQHQCSPSVFRCQYHYI